jgi:hypothetical protein
MNEMYNMGIVTHGTFVFWMLAMILVNYVVILVSYDLKIYRRKRGIFYVPLDFVGLSGVIFTGVVMMASKHLDFTLENIAMIAASLLFIILEVKRAKEFKSVKNMDKFIAYKSYAKKILLIEFTITLLISIWMFI